MMAHAKLAQRQGNSLFAPVTQESPKSLMILQSAGCGSSSDTPAAAPVQDIAHQVQSNADTSSDYRIRLNPNVDDSWWHVTLWMLSLLTTRRNSEPQTPEWSPFVVPYST
jgi:hypothetical protein